MKTFNQSINRRALFGTLAAVGLSLAVFSTPVGAADIDTDAHTNRFNHDIRIVREPRSL